ncbi:MAG: hypothetical protein ABR564_01755 [Candidatus Dormibacteria bacterium]
MIRAHSMAWQAAGLISALLLAACSPPGGHARATAPPARSGVPASSGPAVDTSGMRAAVEAFLPEAQRFVEQHRGLAFTRRVDVTALDDAAFRKRLEELPGDSPADLEKATKELRALGLIQGKVDLGELEKALLGSAVAGFYDAAPHVLVVRGGALTPWVREVIVHELTHALQDQAFGIHRPQLDDAPDEQGIAFHALLEGDALRVENAYHDGMSPADRKSADEEGAGGGIPPDTPPVLLEQLTFPYVAGPPFVSAVLAKRGQPGLDAAIRTPPTTSSQILHPERFLGGQAPVHVDPPPADGRVFDRGALGEEALRLVLGQAVDKGRLGAQEADEAAAAWAGDWASAWDAGSQACIRVLVVTQGPAARLRSALRAYAGTRNGVTVAGNGPLTLTSCG